MKPFTVLILSRDAAVYAAELGDLRSAGVRLLVASETGELPGGAQEVEVALGEPDRLARALPELPSLDWAQSTWAGLTPLVPGAAAGLTVTGVKDVFGGQMAEYVLGHMLSHVLDLPARRRAQAERSWLDAPTGSLAGRTLGVMGTGSIGAEVARRAGAFGMRLLGFSRSGVPAEPFEAVYPQDELPVFLARCDTLVAVLPDTPATRNLLDGTALAALPKGALFINVGRGSVVVDEALVTALESGALGGAVLDVFRNEPLPPTHPFWTTPGLTVTAHVAAWSRPRDIAEVFRDNLARYRAGKALRFLLEADRGY